MRRGIVQTLVLPWGKMAYRDKGHTGRPLVLLHGTGCDSGDWHKVSKLLPPDQRIIRLDFRGHGKSGIPKERFTIQDLAGDVLALLKHLKIDNAVAMGHSLGGMVAMEVASRTDRIIGLVLLEGWTSLSGAAKSFGSRHLFGGFDQTGQKSVITKSKRVIAGFTPQVWKFFWNSVTAYSARQFLETTRLPIQEVYGSLDRLSTTQVNLELPTRLQENLSWIDGAGHYLPVEKPKEVASICQRFMRYHGF